MKKVFKNVIECYKDMGKHNSAAFSASVSFYFFLSLFPTIMFLCSLFTYLPLTTTDLMEFFASFVPEPILGTIEIIIDELYSHAKSMLPITAIATLWTANMGMLGLIRGLNGVLDIEDKRNYFLLRAIATLYTIILLVTLIGSLLIIGFGKHIVATILNQFPYLNGMLRFLLAIRSGIMFIILVLIFSLIYSFLPAKRQHFLQSLPGALFCATGWVIFTHFFSLYVSYFNAYSIYGNLTAIMILLVWLHMCFTILIMGAFINKYYQNSIAEKIEKIRSKRKKK